MSLGFHTVFLLEDGTVRTVGNNSDGQCGTGNTTSPQLSLYTPPIEGVKQVSCGGFYTVFLLEDGTVRTVGHNYYGQCGTGNTTSPQLSLFNPGLTDVKQVSCGYDHTVFLLEDGTVRTVGNNYFGQLGTGVATTGSPYGLTSLQTPNIQGVKQVACGYNHTVFLLEDGTVRTVGRNGYGQCGTGNTSDYQLSLYTPPIEGVKQVSCGGFYTVFLLEDGTVRTVGNNEHGQLGTGTANTSSPYCLTSLQTPPIEGVKQVSCGNYYTVFLLEDGTVRTVGNNAFGQCGTGNTTSPQLSLYTPPIEGVKQVACGERYTVFLLEDGTVRTVGHNGYGQCGTGNTTTPQLTLYNPNIEGVKLLFDNWLSAIIRYLLQQLNQSPQSIVEGQFTDVTLPLTDQVFKDEGMEDLSALFTPTTQAVFPMTYDSDVGEGKVYRANIDITKYKSIQSMTRS